MRGKAKDLVLPPPDSNKFIFLARRERGICRQHHMGLTKKFFERTFGAL